MNVLLINPPRKIPQKADFPPVGLAYICSSLKESGIQSQLIDASSFSWKKLKIILKTISPKIVGLTCWTLEREQTYKTARLAKEILPDVKIIIGGHHASAFPGHMFTLAFADAVVIGEGEITTPELVKALLLNQNLDEINGIAFKRNDKIIITETRDLIGDLDIIPFPSYTDINPEDYLGLPETDTRSAAIITSRGCVYQCIFCSSSTFWRRRWRARSPENVINEIAWLYKEFNIDSFMFFDDNFTVNKKRAIEICKGIIERRLSIKWAACSHVRHIDPELLKWMKRAGCYRIDYGVESGSAEILININKQQKVEHIINTFKNTQDAGIYPRAYLMVGNPGENEDTIADTILLMNRINPYDTESGQILWILPDTKIYDMAVTKGIISDDYWLHSDSMVYYTAEHSLKDLKYLRKKLMKGLTRNKRKRTFYLNYLIRNAYYRFPLMQKFRKWERSYENFINRSSV